MPLPKVNREIVNSVGHETDDLSWKDEMLLRLRRDNPVVADLIMKSMEEMDEAEEWQPEDRKAIVMLSGLLLYRVLEAQGECDKLVEIYG